MAIGLKGARLTVLHTAPAANAALQGARLTVLHTAPSVDAALKGARLTVLHTAPSVGAELFGMRLTVLHTAPSGTQGFQSYGAHQSTTDEQLSGVSSQRGWWRFEE